MTKVIGYVRVSRIGGREGDRFLSPQLQREQIAAVAAREGLEVVGVLEELDASGGDAARPLWNEAIRRVESGEAAGIAVWNLARFSRSVRDALNALERVESAGGRVYSGCEGLSAPSWSPNGRSLAMLACSSDRRLGCKARVAAVGDASVRFADALDLPRYAAGFEVAWRR